MKPQEILEYCRHQRAIKAANQSIKQVTRLLNTQDDIKELKAALENRLNQLSKDDDDVKLALTRFGNGFELDEVKFEKPEFYFKWEKPVINWMRRSYRSLDIDLPVVVSLSAISFVFGIIGIILKCSPTTFPLIFPFLYILRCRYWKEPIK